MVSAADVTVTLHADVRRFNAALRGVVKALAESARWFDRYRFVMGLRRTPPHGMTWPHYITHHARKRHPAVKPNRTRTHRRRA